MRQRRQLLLEKKEPIVVGPRLIAKIVFGFILVTTLSSYIWREYKRSIVIGQEIRATVAVVSKDGGVGIVSYDPSEGKITEIELDELTFQSRSVGQYRSSQLYKLGSYEGAPGEFVRRKLQGFLRLPLIDYVEVEKIGKSGLRSSLWKDFVSGNKSGQLSRLDSLTMYFWSLMYDYQKIPFDALIKEGAFVKNEKSEYVVNDMRLQQFVGNLLFDWRVGEEGMTVSIVNETEVEGLGNDMARFVNNVGMDVISVRSGKEQNREKTKVLLGYRQKENKATDSVIHVIVGPKAEYIYEQDLEEYRSQVVILVGKDMLSMF